MEAKPEQTKGSRKQAHSWLSCIRVHVFRFHEAFKEAWDLKTKGRHSTNVNLWNPEDSLCVSLSMLNTATISYCAWRCVCVYVYTRTQRQWLDHIVSSFISQNFAFLSLKSPFFPLPYIDYHQEKSIQEIGRNHLRLMDGVKVSNLLGTANVLTGIRFLGPTIHSATLVK